MQKKAFIFDLDGTLLDSYAVILASLREVLAHYAISMSMEDVHTFIIEKSVNDLILTLSAQYGLSPVEMRALYTEISHAKKEAISTMPEAMEMLQGLQALGCPLFVYTHRGVSTAPVLKNNGMDGFFLETVTSEAGFPRKPAPDAIGYLISRHQLDKARTYYVGDRPIDMECAHNAGIPGILYLPETSPAESSPYATITIHSLMELISLANKDERSVT